MDSLHGGQNIPTVLQSLGCMAQHSVSAFEARDKEITSYINETFFQVIDDSKYFCLFIYFSLYSDKKRQKKIVFSLYLDEDCSEISHLIFTLDRKLFVCKIIRLFVCIGGTIGQSSFI